MFKRLHEALFRIKGRLLRRFGRRGRIVAGLLVVLTLLVALGLIRLAHRPVSMPWVAQAVTERLQAMIGETGTIAIAESAVFWRGGAGLTVTLDDVVVSMANDIAARIDRIDVDVDVTPLGSRSVALRDIRVTDPDLTIPWPPPLPRPASPLPMPVGPVDGANRLLDAVVSDHGGLLAENVSVNGGTVRTVAAPGGAAEPWLHDVAAVASAGGQALSVIVTGETVRGRAFDAAFERRTDEEIGDGHVVSLSLMGFDFPVSRRAAADPGRGRGWLPIDLSVLGAFSPDYQVRQALFSADIGSGTVALGAKDTSYVRTGQVQLAWQAEQANLAVTRGHLEIGDSVIDLSGTITPPPKDPREPWSFDLAARDVRIDPSDVPGPPLMLEEILIAGRVLPQERSLDFDQLSIRSPQAPLEAIGSVTLQDRGLLVSGAMNLGRMHTDVLKRLWPSFAIAPTRRWMLTNVVDGVVDRARIDLALGPELTDGDPATLVEGNDAVEMDLAFSGVTLKSFGEMSQIENASGRASILNRALEVMIDDANFVAPGGEPVSASQGRFTISDIFAPQRAGMVSFKVSGPNEVVGALANQKPVTALDRVGVKADALSGTVSAKVAVTFPLRKKIQAEDVEWVVDAEFDDLSSATPISGRSIKDADVKIVVDPTMFTMAGIATLDGVRANIQITEPFGDSSTSMSGDLTLVMDAKARAAMGIDLGDALKGSVGVGISVLSDGTKQVAVDLTDAELNLPVFGWTKARGIVGNVAFLLRESGGKRQLENFTFRAGDAAIDGTVVIDAGGRVETVDLSRFSLRKGDVAKLMAKRAKNRFTVEFTGDRVDGRGLIKTLKTPQRAVSGDEAKGSPDYAVTFDIRQLIGFKGETLREVAGNIKLVANAVSVFQAKARTGARGETEARIDTEDGALNTVVSTSDTGALLRFLNLYGDVEHGDGLLQATTTAAGVTSGHVTVTDLTLKTSQEFSSRFAETSRNMNVRDDGPVLPRATRQDTRMSFGKFRAGFVKNGDLLNVTEAYIRSPMIGGSLAGTVNLASQTLDLTGTMIPVYGLNNLFGQIPLLGGLMGAGRHGGLLGVTFRIDGVYSDPKLVINPASALAPGIFRKIFEFR